MLKKKVTIYNLGLIFVLSLKPPLYMKKSISLKISSN